MKYRIAIAQGAIIAHGERIVHGAIIVLEHHSAIILRVQYLYLEYIHFRSVIIANVVDTIPGK